MKTRLKARSPQGTELLARVMVEGQEQEEIEKIAHELAGIIRQAIGQ